MKATGRDGGEIVVVKVHRLEQRKVLERGQSAKKSIVLKRQSSELRERVEVRRECTGE